MSYFKPEAPKKYQSRNNASFNFASSLAKGPVSIYLNQKTRDGATEDMPMNILEDIEKTTEMQTICEMRLRTGPGGIYNTEELKIWNKFNTRDDKLDSHLYRYCHYRNEKVLAMSTEVISKMHMHMIDFIFNKIGRPRFVDTVWKLAKITNSIIKLPGPAGVSTTNC